MVEDGCEEKFRYKPENDLPIRQKQRIQKKNKVIIIIIMIMMTILNNVHSFGSASGSIK